MKTHLRIAGIAITFVFSGSAWSQGEASAQPSSLARPYAFGYFAGGKCNHGFTVLGGGGGGEAFPWSRLGIGGDAGYYQFLEDTSFFLVSFNEAIHLGDRSQTSRVDPFLSVSPGFYKGEDQAGGALGFGGGANFWVRDGVGVRTELRLQAIGTEEGVFLFRVGVTFR